MEKLKVGDLVICHYGYHVGIGYAKVLKIFDKKTKKEFQEYGPVITGRGDENSKLEITVEIVGYDLTEHNNEYDLGEIVEVKEIRILDSHYIYRILDEKIIAEIREGWEKMIKDKIDFFYKNLNKELMEGRKNITSLKIT